MRLHNLFESTTPESLTEDIIDIELTEDFAIEGRILEFTEDGGAIIELDEHAQELVDLDEETLNEVIPLIIKEFTEAGFEKTEEFFEKEIDHEKEYDALKKYLWEF